MASRRGRSGGGAKKGGGAVTLKANVNMTQAIKNLDKGSNAIDGLMNKIRELGSVSSGFSAEKLGVGASFHADLSKA